MSHQGAGDRLLDSTVSSNHLLTLRLQVSGPKNSHKLSISQITVGFHL